ncbi:hypothetical protein GWK47_026835 [Chionoecetes opilio]|uniref:Uncharacterized protein n=1 Tax=Chionoecetes opilio TaxID=41210 RepID=A0A8J8WDF7_CHIOP|nr:hypothetical protein GWK47_026835 [Chionoecetes opilio]
MWQHYGHIILCHECSLCRRPPDGPYTDTNFALNYHTACWLPSSPPTISCFLTCVNFDEALYLSQPNNEGKGNEEHGGCNGCECLETRGTHHVHCQPPPTIVDISLQAECEQQHHNPSLQVISEQVDQRKSNVDGVAIRKRREHLRPPSREGAFWILPCPRVYCQPWVVP